MTNSIYIIKREKKKNPCLCCVCSTVCNIITHSPNVIIQKVQPITSITLQAVTVLVTLATIEKKIVATKLSKLGTSNFSHHIARCNIL